jgi:hypothetical protein
MKKNTISNQIQKSAKKYLATNLSRWDDSEKEMIRMFKKDYEQMIRISDHVRKGSFSWAYTLMMRLDTVVYESLPNTAIRFIEKYN